MVYRYCTQKFGEDTTYYFLLPPPPDIDHLQRIIATAQYPWKSKQTTTSLKIEILYETSPSKEYTTNILPQIVHHIKRHLESWKYKFSFTDDLVEPPRTGSSLPITISFTAGATAIDGRAINFGMFDGYTTEEEFSITVAHMLGHVFGGCHQPLVFGSNPILLNRTGKVTSELYVPSTICFEIPQPVNNKDFADNDEGGKANEDGFETEDMTDDGIITPQYTDIDVSETGTLTPRLAAVSLSDNDQDEPIGDICLPSPHGSSYGAYSTKDDRLNKLVMAWTEKKIEFASKYPSVPSIVAGLTGLDLNSRDTGQVRIACFATDIRRDSFFINLNSWNNTTVYRAGCVWLETTIEQHPEFQVGTFRQPWHSSQKPVNEIIEKIVFDRPYAKPPKVVVWINFIDCPANLSLDVFAINITELGFTLKFLSAIGSIPGAGASWIAYPDGRQGTASGVVSTNDYRTSDEPNATNFGEVVFPKGIFGESIPKVLMAVSHIRFSNGANVQFESYPDRIWKGGFRWNMNSWNTKITTGTLQYLAFV